MRESTIGIKIANGTYFPIVNEKVAEKKRLILTTVNDEQSNVQIDLYKGEGDSLQDALYIGSLVLENIPKAGKGEPEIEFIMGVDSEGNLNASATDLRTGDKQSLGLSLDTLAEDSEFEVPEFDLDTSIEPSGEVTEYDTFDFPETELFENEAPDFEGPAAEGEEDEFEEEDHPVLKERRVNPVLLVVFVVIGLIVVALLAFLIYRSFQGPETPPLQAQQQIEKSAPPPEPEKTEAQAAAGGEQPAPRQDTEAAALSPETAGNTETAVAAAEEPAQPRAEEKPAAQETVKEKRGGVWYWIKWGDTLWDLSQSFYRTPWLYGRIAKENNIKNPDLIYANSKIFIPEL